MGSIDRENGNTPGLPMLQSVEDMEVETPPTLSNNSSLPEIGSDDTGDSMVDTETSTTTTPKKKKTRGIRRTKDDRRPIHLGNSRISYFETEVVGNGKSSTVFKGYYEVSSQLAAVKAVSKEFHSLYLNELKILREFPHPNIVRYFATESTISASSHYIAMELADFTMEDWILDPELNYNPDEAVDLMKQAMVGLEFLHSRRIVHRDIKPSNILLFKQEVRDSDNRNIMAKLTDFGISKKLVELSQTSNSSAKGTPDWMSPEALLSLDEKENYTANKADDIFSMGVTFAFVLTKEHPFGGHISRLLNIVAGNYNLGALTKLHKYEHCNLLHAMLQRVEEYRPKCAELLEHPCFWPGEKRLQFFTTVSNYLSGKSKASQKDKEDIMKVAEPFFSNWLTELEPEVQDFVRNHSPTKKQSKIYKENSVISLIEFIRDKDQHCNEIPENVRKILGETDEKYGNYFSRKFPVLIPLLFVQMQGRNHDRKVGGFYHRNTSKFLKDFGEERPKLHQTGGTPS